MSIEMLRRLAACTPEHRQKLKRELLAMFRRAEMHAIKGGIDDRNYQSLHKRGEKAVIKLVKIATKIILYNGLCIAL